MSAFEFIFSLFGLMLGLALAEGLGSLSNAIKARHKVRIGWATALNMAGGAAKEDGSGIIVSATRGDTAYGIVSTPFLEHAFRTDAYALQITFNDDDSYSYVSDTTLIVRGNPEPFLHRDTNTLKRIAPPKPNPLFEIVSKRERASGGQA